LNSSRPNFYKNRGLAFLGKGQYDRAIEQFNKSIAISPDYGYAYSGRGEALVMLGKNKSALADFKKACEYGDEDSCVKIK
jgi:tetratricopeptide (TPR) repeat protein